MIFFAPVALVVLLNFGNSYGAEVPEFIHVCARDNPDMKACMKNALEDLRPYLKSGYPEYNIPSVEPIYIKDLIKEESAGLKIETSDVVAYGGGDYEVQDVSVDFDNNKIDVDVLIPRLTIDAKYTIDGKLVMVPIKGNGDFFANLTDCQAHTLLVSETYEKDGQKYLRFTSNTLKVKVGGGHIKLGNLFNGDKTLNDVINDTVNKNLGVFIKEIIPYIERALAQNFLATGNQIIEPYTMDQLFP